MDGFTGNLFKEELFTILKVQFHDKDNVLRYGYGCMTNNSDPYYID